MQPETIPPIIQTHNNNFFNDVSLNYSNNDNGSNGDNFGTLGGVDQCNVFVKYLPSNWRDQDLYNLFSPLGTVVSCKVMLDHASQSSLGYG